MVSVGERIASLETSNSYNCEMQKRILEKQDIMLIKIDTLKDDMISKKGVVFISTIISCGMSAITLFLK